MFNVRIIAYKAIFRILYKREFSNVVLTQYTSTKKDRNFFYRLVCGVVKMRINLDYILGNFVNKCGKKQRCFLYISLYQILYMDSIPQYAAINETVNAAKTLYGANFAGFINAVMRKVISQKVNIKYPTKKKLYLSKKYSFPKKLVTTWLDYWNYLQVENLCKYFNEPPLLYLKINKYLVSVKELISYFTKKDIKVEVSEYSKDVLKTQDSRVITDDKFKNGSYYFQSLSNAILVEGIPTQKENTVLDCFAAPGGKSIGLAHKVEKVIAIEKYPSRAKILLENTNRLKKQNIQIVVSDIFKYKKEEKFNIVLADVPCSGWGVIQRKSELRYQKFQNINQLITLQKNALNYIKRFVKDGGFLVYSTCTFNKKENEDIIKKFLQENKEFYVVEAINFFSPNFVDEKYFKTIPFIHKIDGLFAAILRKINL